VTSPPQPVPGEGKSAGQYLRPLRDLAAYALVGATAVLLFVAIVRLIPGGPHQFGYRTQDSFYGFVNLETIFFPIAAVLLALLVQPRHPKARLIVIAAVVEYAVAAVFAILFGVLIGLINHAANNGARTAIEELLVRLAWLAVFAVAAYATFLIWRNMFATPRPPKPAPQPGVYGQSQYGAPGAYPGQPGYGPPGQPGYPPPPGQPGYGPPPGGPGFPPQADQPAGATYPPAPGQTGYGPTTYGQPAQAPSWNQPAAPVPVPPTSVPPGAFAEPTQVVPQHDPNVDRTHPLDDNRPGAGPADQDPPRS
jgi:hypothetical protein